MAVFKGKENLLAERAVSSRRKHMAGTICCLISSIHSGLVRYKFTQALSLGDH